jgi:putative addiction module component (TIGR02574 family)
MTCLPARAIDESCEKEQHDVRTSRKNIRRSFAVASSERADLAERLLDSLAVGTDERFDALWAAEAESRIAAFRRGELAAVPAEDVFAEIEAETS